MASSTRRDPDALTRILDRQLNVITRQQALTGAMTRHALGHRPWPAASGSVIAMQSCGAAVAGGTG
jgi:hypothetical protein